MARNSWQPLECCREKCSCYPAVGPEVTQAGGTFADVAMTEAVVDGNSGDWPGVAGTSGMASKFLVLLGTRIEL